MLVTLEALTYICLNRFLFFIVKCILLKELPNYYVESYL